MRDLIPVRRTEDLVVRESGGESLVLDTRTDAVHCLPQEMLTVWLALDSASSMAELMQSTGTSEGSVSAALTALNELDLLESPAGFDRRRFFQRTALIGGAGLAGAVTVALPAAAAGTSPGVTGTDATIPPAAGTAVRMLMFTASGYATGSSPVDVTLYTDPAHATADGSSGMITLTGGTGTATITTTKKYAVNSIVYYSAVSGTPAVTVSGSVTISL